MKSWLITWYGITDLRAAQSLEGGEGPVLSALLAEAYSHVLILGYSRAASPDNNAALTQPGDIGALANTPQAHRLFIDWLTQRLAQAGRSTAIDFRPVPLTHLNDTQGIYEAATDALTQLAQMPNDKRVTLYLSPGTPVMAFAWAFAALKYPNLKKRLITASQPGKAPETIALPDEWLEWHGRQRNLPDENTRGFDVIFHLFGEQRIPGLLAIRQFPCLHHIFVNTSRFPAAALRQFTGSAVFEELAIDPWDTEQVRSTLLERIAQLPAGLRIGFNLTGGTKLMFAGALAACRKVNATPFYFEGKSKQVVFLNDYRKQPLATLNSVDDFLLLNGDGLKISKPGRVGEEHLAKKLTLARALWKQRHKIVSKYRELKPHADQQTPSAFILRTEQIYAELTDDYQARLTIGSERVEFDYFPGLARFLMGEWLELYVYSLLKPLLDQGVIKDLRLGLEVSVAQTEFNPHFSEYAQNYSDHALYQEFDVIFTDGYTLTIVECKSGSVTSEQVVKLHQISKKFGGGDGKAILVSSFKAPHPVTRQKAQDLTIDWYYSNGMEEALLQRFGSESA